MIGGNKEASFQVKASSGKNDIGEAVENWTTIQTIEGWLDMSGGDSKYTTFNAKIQESTHIFVGDYVKLNEQIKAENSRLVVDGKPYDVLVIDNPMELNKQLEIYLKYTGGR